MSDQHDATAHGDSESGYGQFHRRVLESRGAVMAVLTTIVISIGGIVEIVPMFRPAGTTPGHSFELARLLLQFDELSETSDPGRPSSCSRGTSRTRPPPPARARE